MTTPESLQILPRDVRILIKDLCKVCPEIDPAPWGYGDQVMVASNGVVVVFDKEDHSHTFGAFDNAGKFTREGE